MVTVNSVISDICKDQTWSQKALLGSILMFIPIVNLFSLGYLSRYAAQVLEEGELELPQWDSWGYLFLGGIWFLLVIIAYGILPMLLGWLLGMLFASMTFHVLGWFPFFPITIAAAVSPTFVVLGLLSIRNSQHPKGFLLDIQGHMKRIMNCWDKLIVINMAFMGLLLFGLPIYGLTIFLGFIILIPYTALVLIEVEKK